MTTTFRRRLLAREFLVGSFVKTAAPQQIEIAAIAGLDFVVLDAEHAPLSSGDIDRGVLAGRAVGLAVIVRVPDHKGPWIQQALDVGAEGVMVPHVSSAAIAKEVVQSARFKNGSRGYSNSPRAGAYGEAAMAELIRHEDRRVSVIVQIEDRGGVENLDEIADVIGVDAIFVGVADLAVAYEAPGATAPEIVAVVNKVTSWLSDRGRACGVFLSDAAGDHAPGSCFWIIGSDQSVLKTGWRKTVETFRQRLRQGEVVSNGPPLDFTAGPDTERARADGLSYPAKFRKN